MFEKKIPYIRKETKLPKYVPIPSSLLGSKVSSTAVLLYGELLNRATLSQKNDMTDAQGNVYVIYPINQLSLALNISESQVKKLMKELVENNLLEKRSGGFNKPNHLFLHLPKEKTNTVQDGTRKGINNATSVVSKKQPLGEQKGATNYYSKTIDKTTYTYGEGESF